MFESTGNGSRPPEGAAGAAATATGTPSSGAHAEAAGTLGAPESARTLSSLEGVRDTLSALADVTAHARTWTGADRARAVAVLDRIASLVTVVRAPVLAAQQAAAVEVGAERAFTDTRARLTGTTRGQVAAQVRTAETLGRLGGVRAAMTDGVVRDGHVDVLARTVEQAPAAVAEVLATPQGQAAVVELARGVDAREFGRSLDAWVAAQDVDHHESRREAQRRARFLVLTHASEGTFLRGRLDPVAGRALQRALDATGHRADTDRTREQAAADALTALADSPVLAAAPVLVAALSATPTPCDSRPTTAAAVNGAPTTPTPGDSPPTAPAAVDRLPTIHDGPATPGAASEDADVPDGKATTRAVPHVSLLVPAETWVAVRARAARRRARRAAPPAPGSSPLPRMSQRLDAETVPPPTTAAAQPVAVGADEAAGRVGDVDGRAATTRHDAVGQPRAIGTSDGIGAPRGSDDDRVSGTAGAQRGGAVRATTVQQPAVTEDGVVLSGHELAAALCDCAMTRVVMDAAGRPLDVGRTRRAFTPAQRLAVVARDRMCAWNGCSVPPAYCEVHHIAWWHRDGGTSDLVNAVLLCSFHHHEVHRLDLDVERIDPFPPSRRVRLGAGTPSLRSPLGVSPTSPVSPASLPTSPTSREVYDAGSTGAPTTDDLRAAGMRYVFRARSGRMHNAPAAPRATFTDAAPRATFTDAAPRPAARRIAGSAPRERMATGTGPAPPATRRDVSIAGTRDDED